jgi:hypothetical protein
MLTIKLKRSIATVAAIACVLGAAGPASASAARVHAGGGWDPLGYQHNQDDLDPGFWLGSNDALGAVKDGTSNTMVS